MEKEVTVAQEKRQQEGISYNIHSRKDKAGKPGPLMEHEAVRYSCMSRCVLGTVGTLDSVSRSLVVQHEIREGESEETARLDCSQHIRGHRYILSWVAGRRRRAMLTREGRKTFSMDTLTSEHLQKIQMAISRRQSVIEMCIANTTCCK